MAEHSASFLVHRLEGWWIEEIPTAAVRQNHYQQGRQPAATKPRLTRLRLAFRARAGQLPWAKKRRRYPRSPRHFRRSGTADAARHTDRRSSSGPTIKETLATAGRTPRQINPENFAEVPNLCRICDKSRLSAIPAHNLRKSGSGLPRWEYAIVRMSLTAAKSDFLSVRPEQERKILRLLTPLAKLGVPDGQSAHVTPPKSPFRR